MSELNVYHHELRPNEYDEFYLKYEADKVIARHKYKRCLAMAKYCDASMAYFGEFHDSASERMVAHCYKWRSRWYELAEKFKEAK